MTDIGLTVCDPTGDGETKLSMVLLRGQKIGDLRETGGMAFWKAEAGADLGLQIGPMISWNRDALIDTLHTVIARQLRRLAQGEALTPDDIDPLDPELRGYLSERTFGTTLQHPLVYAVPYTPEMAPNYNQSLKLKRAEVAQARAEKNWRQYIHWHERPYRLQALLSIINDLSDADYWTLVSNFWTDSENIFQNFRIWKRLWSAKHPGREGAMDQEERDLLAELPEIVTIYRGFQHKASMRGMSWTLDRDRAIWFARRYRASHGTAYLATAEVKRARILACLIDRNEQEIVVMPKDLKNVKFEKLPEIKTT